MIQKKLYGSQGMPLFRLPVGQNDRINTKKKNIGDLESTTAANMIHMTGIRPDSPMILCGKHNKAYPVLRQMIKMTPLPYAVIGTQKDLGNSCFSGFQVEWHYKDVKGRLPSGNGMLTLKPGAETSFMLKEVMQDWDDHLVIICLGNGLQIDSELFNLLNGLGQYILVVESLSRSLNGCGGYRLTVEELLSNMDYILVSSIGTSAKNLMTVLPSYECEKITNATDFSIHRDAPNPESGSYHHRNGGVFRIGQTRTQETKCIFTQDDLTRMQDNNSMLIYNAKAAHIWVAKIVR